MSVRVIHRKSDNKPIDWLSKYYVAEDCIFIIYEFEYKMQKYCKARTLLAISTCNKHYKKSLSCASTSLAGTIVEGNGL